LAPGMAPELVRGARITLLTRAPLRNRTVDLLLTMLISGRSSTAAMLVRAGFVVVLMLVNVASFRPVLARDWQGRTPSLSGFHTRLLAPVTVNGEVTQLDTRLSACSHHHTLLYFAAVTPIKHERRCFASTNFYWRERGS